MSKLAMGVMHDARVFLGVLIVDYQDHNQDRDRQRKNTRTPPADCVVCDNGGNYSFCHSRSVGPWGGRAWHVMAYMG